MEKEPLIKLTWRGHETIESIPPLLSDARQIEIILPTNYNHSLFCALHPGEPPAQLEEINTSGGPELLAAIATVKGLEEFIALARALTTAHIEVHVVSPPSVIIKPVKHPDA
ncbi:hypothetical protein SAMN05216428_105154 [Nitrosospira sp. Nsp11]|uniref:hypothetical protein n=1 Tax=unclassified Nitrosospira TaxID=2609267 RepID=UPI00088D64F4|nr:MULTISPECIES: hypothetical protein [unclassified Nitrosospira]SDA16369.1 hypothetical protein SAMN05216315_107110 [Nitrosospira sp. Nsp18]SHL73121.1 hypothetical protein SAMN05216428_105154 [Nitrosospira sp. Nsp11]